MLAALTVGNSAARVGGSAVGATTMGEQRLEIIGEREGGRGTALPSPWPSTAVGSVLGGDVGVEARRGSGESREREAQRLRRGESSREVPRYMPCMFAGASSHEGSSSLPSSSTPPPPLLQRAPSPPVVATTTTTALCFSAAVVATLAGESSSSSSALTPTPPPPSLLPSSAPSLDEDEGRMATATTVVGECLVCMDREATHALVPCGHVVACEACVAALRDCPLCRAHVTSTLKIFLPHRGGAPTTCVNVEAMATTTTTRVLGAHEEQLSALLRVTASETAGTDEEGRDYIIVKGRRFYAAPY